MRCLLLACAAGLLVDVATLDLKERPVNKVIRLLNQMSAQLEKEGKEDQALYDKLSCWCTTNEKEKSGATQEAQRRITSLVAEIQRLSGKQAELQATVAQLDKETAANQAALAQAEEVRAKEHAEFNQDEKDLMQAIESLRNAVQVLGKHHQSFLQLPATSLVEVKGAVYHVLQAKHVPASQRQALSKLLQQPAGAGESYAPQSGQIFGILSQMKEEFESNLSDSQKAEMRAASEFADLKQAKTREIQASTAASKSKTAAAADAGDSLAAAKEDLADTRDALSADTQFLLDLNLRCQQTDKDFELRSKTRTEEIAAVSETIKILSEDDARDQFSKTLNFVQKEAHQSDHRRSAASAVLRKAGQKSALLLALSTSVQLDSFTAVKAAIDKMVAGLKQEQADEVAQKDQCGAEITQNDKDTASNDRELHELQTLIASSDDSIESLSRDIAALQAANKETKAQMDAATEDRNAENKEFQELVADHRATQDILKKALARMQAFYGFLQANKKANNWRQAADAKADALMQEKYGFDAEPEPGADVEPMPAGFKTYKTSGGSSGVLTLLQSIIDDSSTAEKEAHQAEADAQASYEEVVSNSNASINANNKSITSKTGERADAEATKSMASGDQAAATSEDEQLTGLRAQLHGSCDFLLANFDLRQVTRSQEMEALAQAKAILSGADPR